MKQFGWVIGILLFLALVVVVAVVLSRSDSTNETNGADASQAVPEAEDPEETPEAEQTAVYAVEYNVPWGPDSHPDSLPPGPHVSPIVVVSHMGQDDLFASGTLATDGVEMMAETGATEVLVGEIGDNPSILSSVVGTRIDVPGSNRLELEFDRDHPLLTAVSMLAPSPDWFVAVNNVELFLDGQWLEEVELPMRPYDAGTDSGETFTAADFDTSPAKTIGPPVDSAFANAAAEGDFATITVTKI